MSETVPKASLGILCDLVAGGTPSTSDLSLWSDDPVVGHPWIAIGDMSRRKNVSSTMKHVSDKGLEKARLPVGEPGTVLFAIYASVGETAILDIRATWNQAILGLPPKDKTKLDSKFLYYALLTLRPELPIHYRSNTQHNLNAETVSRLQIPLPSLETQRRIADWLDRETGEIDAMIEKLDSLGEQLSERKSILPSNYFVGDYERVKLKWLLDEVDVRAGVRTAELPLLSVSIHHGVQLRDGSLTNQNPSENLSHYKVAQSDQIVLNRMRAFQGGLGVSKWDGLVSPDYSVLQLQDDLAPGWAEFMMRTPEFVSTMTQALRGIGGVDQGNVRTPRINVRDLLELSIPLPPLEEQRRIADHLHEVTSKIDAMLAKVAELKNLLTERRAALIADVVSGRKDVA